jgi:endonuclease YncB( thermonuclease family)
VAGLLERRRRAALVDLMKGKRTECQPKATDRYERTVAICRVDGVDLGMAMVSGGVAWAFIRYSHDSISRSRRRGPLG